MVFVLLIIVYTFHNAIDKKFATIFNKTDIRTAHALDMEKKAHERNLAVLSWQNSKNKNHKKNISPIPVQQGPDAMNGAVADAPDTVGSPRVTDNMNGDVVHKKSLPKQDTLTVNMADHVEMNSKQIKAMEEKQLLQEKILQELDVSHMEPTVTELPYDHEDEQLMEKRNPPETHLNGSNVVQMTKIQNEEIGVSNRKSIPDRQWEGEYAPPVLKKYWGSSRQSDEE